MARLPLNDLDVVSSIIGHAYPELAAHARAGLAAWRDFLEVGADDGAAWTSSSLTGDGWPLEIGHAFGSRAIGWTAEVAGPHVAPAERLRRAARFTRTPPAISDALAGVQAGRASSFGAWLGVRYSALGESRKLYVEVPPGRTASAAAFAAPWIGTEPVLATRSATCRLIAYRPEGETCELYFRIERLARWELERIAARAALPGAGERLCEFAAELIGLDITDALPGLQHGFSIAIGRERTFALTLYLFARALGSDTRIRERLVAFARAHGWDTDGYEQLAAGSRRTDSRTDHGMLALSIEHGQEPRLAVGIRVRAGP